MTLILERRQGLRKACRIILGAYRDRKNVRLNSQTHYRISNLHINYLRRRTSTFDIKADIGKGYLLYLGTPPPQITIEINSIYFFTLSQSGYQMKPWTNMGELTKILGRSVSFRPFICLTASEFC